ncbi:hypothetical protein [Saccharopolyspora spinosa]|uniref:hypothetical protein n=1 Tax=Saccharopolyspora spinosa TaxID=60894 RepID=UPI0006776EF0|nr:hypothetical protein [Saccharopolyspora spinosa]
MGRNTSGRSTRETGRPEAAAAENGTATSAAANQQAAQPAANRLAAYASADRAPVRRPGATNVANTRPPKQPAAAASATNRTTANP